MTTGHDALRQAAFVEPTSIAGVWSSLVPLGRMGENEELEGLALLLPRRPPASSPAP